VIVEVGSRTTEAGFRKVSSRYNISLVKHRSPIVLIAAFIAAFLASSLAVAQTETKTADVIDLSGVWDERIIEFAIDSIEGAAASGTVEYVVLAIDSEGVVAGPEQLSELADLVSNPPLPVVTWIGAAPAKAYGGAAQVALAADVALAAPGSEIGYLEPTIAGDDDSAPVIDLTGLAGYLDTAILVDDAGLFDEVGPDSAAPRQVGQFLNGREVATADGVVVLETVREFEGGVTNLETVIREPNLIDQFFRLAASPEAAFFFLLAGLTVASFEFYAIGPGIAAGTAAVSLVLAGYGLAVLPVRWWAVVLATLSVLLMAWSYQRGGIFLFTTLGIVGLGVAGFLFTDAAPQISPSTPGVLFTIGSAAFFFLLAMPTVARSRFSPQTIGREGLIGRVGEAVTALTPDGEVDIDGAVWRATSHREAGISPGDPIEVVGVEGWYLEVDVPS
jgi:membrane-bound serine protease (ClpP class)